VYLCSGFIDKKMVQEHLPAAGAGTHLLVCGPPPMIKFACKPAFEALGHAAAWDAF
jgi:NAD(P)H-flavin reductase